MLRSTQVNKTGISYDIIDKTKVYLQCCCSSFSLKWKTTLQVIILTKYIQNIHYLTSFLEAILFNSFFLPNKRDIILIELCEVDLNQIVPEFNNVHYYVFYVEKFCDRLVFRAFAQYTCINKITRTKSIHRYISHHQSLKVTKFMQRRLTY